MCSNVVDSLLNTPYDSLLSHAGGLQRLIANCDNKQPCAEKGAILVIHTE